MKRCGSGSSYGSNKRTKYSRQKTVVRDRTTGIKPLVTRNKKAVRVKVPKKVKVSGQLKAKIMKVIEKKIQHVNGSYTDNWSGQIMAPLSRRQNVIDPLGYTPLHFTSNAFLNVASVLFNKKPVPTNVLDWAAPQALNMFDSKNIIIDVKDSYTYYTFKNGSQHVIELTLCVCVPKKKGFTAEWIQATGAGIKNDGTTVANSAAYYGPAEMWNTALIEDYDNGLLLQGYMPPTNDNVGAVLSQPAITDMWRRPTESPTFNNMWKTETIRIVLQPGQVCVHKIQGPQGITIDYSKMYQNDILLNVQKYTRGVIAIVVNQPNVLTNVNNQGVGDAGTAGRWADQTNTVEAGFGLYVERTDHYSIKMPEQTGFTVTDILGDQQVLNMRRPRSVNNNWFPAHPDAPEGRIEEVLDLSIMNPQQPVLPRTIP